MPGFPTGPANATAATTPAAQTSRRLGPAGHPAANGRFRSRPALRAGGVKAFPKPRSVGVSARGEAATCAPVSVRPCVGLALHLVCAQVVTPSTDKHIGAITHLLPPTKALVESDNRICIPLYGCRQYLLRVIQGLREIPIPHLAVAHRGSRLVPSADLRCPADRASCLPLIAIKSQLDARSEPPVATRTPRMHAGQRSQGQRIRPDAHQGHCVAAEVAIRSGSDGAHQVAAAPQTPTGFTPIGGRGSPRRVLQQPGTVRPSVVPA